MFTRNPFSQHLALLANLFPGVLIQLPQRPVLTSGGGWLKGLHQRPCQELDRELQALGFLSLGSLSCKFMPGWSLRGFCHPQEHCWGVHYLGLLWGSQFDFVSEFSQDRWLTTTSFGAASSRDPERKLFQVVAGRSPSDMWRSHRQRVATLDWPVVFSGGQRELADSIRRYFGWPKD